MRELALFAGAGGGILGGLLLGWRTVCAVEIEPYCRRVLMQRQNDGVLAPFPIWDDVRTFDGKPWRGLVDVVSGGFPCQDISAAGKGAGIDGERSGLWGEMARIIGEVRPRFAFVENSPMLTVRGLGRVLGDLAEMGFDARWGVVSAASQGAPHLRERIWIMAYPESINRRNIPKDSPDGSGWNGRGESDAGCFDAGEMADSARLLEGRQEQRPERERTGESGESSATDTNSERLEGTEPVRQRECVVQQLGDVRSNADSTRLAQREGEPSDDGPQQPTTERTSWWLTEPALGRVANGVADRVDRLKAIGNGQVPAVVRAAWELLT
jgi:DNA (cytosine-5)-methyltransferase 1